MKKVVRLSESDLVRLVNKVLNEGVSIGRDSTPENFIKKQKDGTIGSWRVKNGVLSLYHDMDPNKSQAYTDLTCSPQ